MIGLGEGSYLGRSRTYYDQNSPTVGGPVSWNVAEEGYLKKKPNRVLFFFFSKTRRRWGEGVRDRRKCCDVASREGPGRNGGTALRRLAKVSNKERWAAHTYLIPHHLLPAVVCKDP